MKSAPAAMHPAAVKAAVAATAMSAACVHGGRSLSHAAQRHASRQQRDGDRFHD
jgi:hypothetical protein